MSDAAHDYLAAEVLVKMLTIRKGLKEMWGDNYDAKMKIYRDIVLGAEAKNPRPLLEVSADLSRELKEVGKYDPDTAVMLHLAAADIIMERNHDE